VQKETPERIIAGVGRRVAEIRESLGLTQQEMAERLRMPLKNLQRIEAGMNLTIRTLVRLARGLGAPTRTLFEEPESSGGRRVGRPSRKQQSKA
jgi:transcriptional regulator with XRE-family HTH domain